MALHTLENEHWQVGILPETGASTAFGRVRHGNEWVDIMRPTDPADYGDSSACASYLLVPWSNRIRDGVFRFQEQEHRLRVNFADGTAIHGDVRDRPWTIESADVARIQLSFDSRQFNDMNWPFAFSAKAVFELSGADFIMRLSLTNEDTRPMPGGFGHHPYFVRYGTGASVLLEIPCGQQFMLDNCLPDAAPQPISDEADFRELRPIGDTFFDHLLTGRESDDPVRLVYPAWDIEVRMFSDPIFEHVIVYAPDKPYYAVEPVTNANDGFNLHEKGVLGTGVFILQPGETREGTVRMRVALT